MHKKNIQQEVISLFLEQSENWPLLKDNIEGLKSVSIREFHFEGFSFKSQFNPKRIRSSAAKVDRDSIRQRACFLCSDNRPEEQKGVDLGNGYVVLCNPYPIFQKHFTIVKKWHVLQRIKNEFQSFLEISKELPDLAIFYNGPKCGASAPDHMHFQAGNKGLMPVEQEINSLVERFGELVLSGKNTSVHAVDDQIRRFIYVESGSMREISDVFQSVYNTARSFKDEDEPMMNLLCYYDEGWKLYIFLRSNHRPYQYDLEGEEQIVFSPATVDFGGTLIFPLEKDYLKVDHSEIKDMMSQVSLNHQDFSVVRDNLKEFSF